MKVFICYGTESDQIHALRVQTLAVVYGMTVYVPPVQTRRGLSPAVAEDVREHLNASDVVISIMTSNPAPAAQSEVNMAVAAGRVLIPIVGPAVDEQFYRGFDHFRLDPANPAGVEARIVQYLQAHKKSRDNSTAALIALSTVAVGMLLFALADAPKARQRSRKRK